MSKEPELKISEYEEEMLDLISKQTIVQLRLYDAIMLSMYENPQTRAAAVALTAAHDDGRFMANGPYISSDTPFDTALDYD